MKFFDGLSLGFLLSKAGQSFVNASNRSPEERLYYANKIEFLAMAIFLGLARYFLHNRNQSRLDFTLGLLMGYSAANMVNCLDELYQIFQEAVNSDVNSL